MSLPGGFHDFDDGSGAALASLDASVGSNTSGRLSAHGRCRDEGKMSAHKRGNIP